MRANQFQTFRNTNVKQNLSRFFPPPRRLADITRETDNIKPVASGRLKPPRQSTHKDIADEIKAFNEEKAVLEGRRRAEDGELEKQRAEALKRKGEIFGTEDISSGLTDLRNEHGLLKHNGFRGEPQKQRYTDLDMTNRIATRYVIAGGENKNLEDRSFHGFKLKGLDGHPDRYHKYHSSARDKIERSSTRPKVHQTKDAQYSERNAVASEKTRRASGYLESHKHDWSDINSMPRRPPVRAVDPSSWGSSAIPKLKSVPSGLQMPPEYRGVPMPYRGPKKPEPSNITTRGSVFDF